MFTYVCLRGTHFFTVESVLSLHDMKASTQPQSDIFLSIVRLCPGRVENMCVLTAVLDKLTAKFDSWFYAALFLRCAVLAKVFSAAFILCCSTQQY